MSPALYGPLFGGSLFVAMLILIEIGRRVGEKRLSEDAEGARTGVGAVEGALFGLLGLMIAFTFSGAASRFDSRRDLVAEEANDIGTAWLRIDLLPASAQPAMRELFRQYLDARLGTYQKLPDIPAAKAELARAVKLQGDIWALAVSTCREQSSPPVTILVISALNQMIDITTTRTTAAMTHPPVIVFVMLGVLALGGSLLAGFGMAGAKSRSWLHIIGFAGIMAATVYVILDLEHPRFGFIRLDAFDQVLVELRQSMK